jgi:hypothetical protein
VTVRRIWQRSMTTMPINRSIFVDSWAGRIAGGKLHGACGQGQERRRGMARTVAGFVAGGTRIDRAEM